MNISHHLAGLGHSALTILIYSFSVLGAIIFLVITHELGHFVAARLAGVKCPEFFVGFGPRIWSARRGETEFGLKWILVGGYVKVLGMNPEEEVSPEDFPHSYKGVSYGKRFWIIFSGSLVHIILALLTIFFTVWLVGVPFASRTVSEVEQYMEEAGEETPAHVAGLQAGDAILAMNGQSMQDWEEVSGFIADHPGEKVTLLVERDGERIELTAELARRDDGRGYLGISPQAAYEHYSFLASFKETGVWFGRDVAGVFYGIYRIFNLSTLKQLLGIAPPTEDRPQTVVGISRIAGQFAGLGIYYFLQFMAFILVFLAIINLAPLPPLDGGHILVLVWEKVTGREVDMRKLYPVAVAVLAFFVIMFVLAFRLDITNPISLP